MHLLSLQQESADRSTSSGVASSLAHHDESLPITPQGHRSLEERSMAEGAGEDSGLQINSKEMLQDGGATHSPSGYSSPPPPDSQSPHDEHEHRKHNSLSGNCDDMQMDDMGTEQCGKQDTQAGHSSSPSLEEYEHYDNNSFASNGADMQMDDMEMEPYGRQDAQAGHSPSPSLDPNDECEHSLHENDSCAGSHDDNMQVNADQSGQHTHCSSAGHMVSPLLNNNLKDGRVTRSLSASPQYDVNCPLKHRHIVLSPSDDNRKIQIQIYHWIRMKLSMLICMPPSGSIAWSKSL